MTKEEQALINAKLWVIFDDIIDTGGTIINAVKALKEKGAKKVIVAATHGLFSRGFDMFENNDLVDEVIVSNSTSQSQNLIGSNYKKLKVLSLAKFLALVIEANINKTSITEVYNAYSKRNIKFFRTG